MSSGNLAVLEELVDDDIVENEETPGLPPGKEGVLAFFAAAQAAFPDFRMAVEDVIASGDRVWARVTMSGTQRGEFLGVPASGKQVAVPLVDIFRFANGKVVEHWGVMDSGVLQQQLGSE